MPANRQERKIARNNSVKHSMVVELSTLMPMDCCEHAHNVSSAGAAVVVFYPRPDCGVWPGINDGSWLIESGSIGLLWRQFAVERHRAVDPGADGLRDKDQPRCDGKGDPHAGGHGLGAGRRDVGRRRG